MNSRPEDESRKRRYNQTRRAELAAETRRRIMDAARACLIEQPIRHLNLDEIARRAGVSRSTIHTIYRSRSEFFVAMAKDVMERSGFLEVIKAFEEADAREAFEKSHANLMRFYETDFPLHRAFNSLAALDPDIEAALEDLRRLHREHSEFLAQRLREDGYLPAAIDDREAADVIWLVTGFETFSDLYSHANLSASQVAQRLLSMAERTLGIEPVPAVSSGSAAPVEAGMLPAHRRDSGQANRQNQPVSGVAPGLAQGSTSPAADA